MNVKRLERPVVGKTRSTASFSSILVKCRRGMHISFFYQQVVPKLLFFFLNYYNGSYIDYQSPNWIKVISDTKFLKF